jgi:hypothetical protein
MIKQEESDTGLQFIDDRQTIAQINKGPYHPMQPRDRLQTIADLHEESKQFCSHHN